MTHAWHSLTHSPYSNYYRFPITPSVASIHRPPALGSMVQSGITHGVHCPIFLISFHREWFFSLFFFSAVEPIHWVFKFRLLYFFRLKTSFWCVFMAFISLMIFSISLLRLPSFSFISSVFEITHWSILMMTALTSVSSWCWHRLSFFI